jgi:hypothetical protein
VLLPDLEEGLRRHHDEHAERQRLEQATRALAQQRTGGARPRTHERGRGADRRP